MSTTFSAATRLLRSCPSTSRARVSALRSSPASYRLSSRQYSASAADTSASSEDAKPPPTTDADASAAKLKAKEEEVADLASRLKYAQADFVNLQKISQREKDQASLYAITNFARDLVGTVDVLALALKSVPQDALESNAGESSKHLKQLHEGVSMTQRALLQTLSKYGVTSFDPTGEPFDPNYHEALYEAPVPGKEPGSVIECSKLGYKIKERTLRAAQVGVAR